LVRALPLGVLLVDRGGRVTVANAAAAAVFGFDVARAPGLHLIEAIPNLQLEARVNAALAGDASLGPLIVPGKTGNRTYAVSAYPLAEEARGVVGALVLADDQTEIVALERARQDFMSNVSHELRTPLSSIKLMLETVLASPDPETADVFLPQALEQVDRLSELVGQMLDQARVEAGQLKLHLSDVELGSVAAPIVASFAPTAREKGVSLTLHTFAPVRLEADADRLAQIFVNLIDNALRHTPEGGSVNVDVYFEGDAVVRVRDTGAGIPYRDLPHIFERFYVVDRSRTRESSGVGLGLAIVRQIVEAHGGSITTDSMLGSGTTFTVRLPKMGPAPRY
jgi:signal transduction histidine kinase